MEREVAWHAFVAIRPRGPRRGRGEDETALTAWPDPSLAGLPGRSGVGGGAGGDGWGSLRATGA